jgi:hypothetical protein
VIGAILLSAAAACTPLFTSAGVQQDAVSVYALSADGHRIVRFFKDGGAPFVIADSGRFTIAAFDLDGARIEYTTEWQPLNQLRSVTITGGAPVVLANDEQPLIGVAHDSNAVFWTEQHNSEIWRYDKRRGIAQQFSNGTIMGADDDALYVRGPVYGGTGDIAQRITPGQKLVQMAYPIDEPFLDAAALYFRRGEQLWRVPKDGAGGNPIAPLPRGPVLLGVGANRIFTTAGAADVCSGKTTPLRGSERIAVDACAVHEVVGDALVTTPFAAPLRIDRTLPAAAAPGQLVQILGAGFDPLARVTIGNAEAAVVLATETELDALVPAIPPIGVTIKVENRGGPCAAAFFNVMPR